MKSLRACTLQSIAGPDASQNVARSALRDRPLIDHRAPSLLHRPSPPRLGGDGPGRDVRPESARPSDPLVALERDEDGVHGPYAERARNRGRGIRMERRGFLKLSAAVAGARLLVPWHEIARGADAGTRTQVAISGGALRQFVDPMPALEVVQAGTERLTLHMREFRSRVLPTGFSPPDGPYRGTWTWGYLRPGQTQRASYLGPVIVARRGTQPRSPGSTTLARRPTVTCSLTPDRRIRRCTGPIPRTAASTRAPKRSSPPPLRLGDAPSITTVPSRPPFTCTVARSRRRSTADPTRGSPATGAHRATPTTQPIRAWPTSAVYRYPNAQEAAATWFHDHTLGATRLNVYAGLAGAYVVTRP